MSPVVFNPRLITVDVLKWLRSAMNEELAKSIKEKLINGMSLNDAEVEAWMTEMELLGNQATKKTAIPDKPKNLVKKKLNKKEYWE